MCNINYEESNDILCGSFDSSKHRGSKATASTESSFSYPCLHSNNVVEYITRASDQLQQDNPGKQHI